MSSFGRFLNIRNEFVYSLLPLAIAVNVAGGLILLFILSLSELPPGVWLWFACLVGISLVRITLYAAYRRKFMLDQQFIQRLYVGSIVGSAIIWGVSAFFLNHVELAAKISILLMIVGISAGGLSSSVASQKGFLLYLVAILGPLFGWLFSQSDITYKATSLTVVLYILMLTAIAKNFGRQYYRTLELQEQEEALNQRLSESNDKLESEIVERRRMECDLIKAKVHAEQASRSKSAFLSHLSHELRTPLNSILGFSELIEHDGNLHGPQRESIHQIHRAGNHLLDLVNDVLDLATIDSGKLTLNNRQINLHDVVCESEVLMRHLAKEYSVQLQVDLKSFNGIAIYADSIRMKQILLNLISNATKYNRQNGGWVKVFAKKDQDHLELSVEDNGKGISEAKISDIFSPFDRVGQENSNIEGTGIGLTITKRLVEMMGGSLLVESTEGEGTIFKVVFSYTQEKPNTAQKEDGFQVAPGHEDEEYSIDGLILLVEDNKANQMIMTKQLLKLGYRVDCVENGKRALERIAQTTYDLVITDCNMPEMDGYEFTKCLRQRELQTGEHCPVIAITADAYEETAQRCMEVGMDAYLSKPVDLQSLKLVAQKWVK